MKHCRVAWARRTVCVASSFQLLCSSDCKGQRPWVGSVKCAPLLTVSLLFPHTNNTSTGESLRSCWARWARRCSWQNSHHGSQLVVVLSGCLVFLPRKGRSLLRARSITRSHFPPCLCALGRFSWFSVCCELWCPRV